MQLKHLCACALAATALSVGSAALGALATTWEADFDEESKSWKEIQAQMPAYPKPENLAAVEVGASSHRYYVDTASVSLGEDGVMRYTMLLKTSGGATNVTFEGIRCATREGKLYAIGRTDGTWTRARDPKWERIVTREHKLHQYVLFREYFCPSPVHPTPPKLAIDALRRGTGLGTSRAIQ